MATYTDAMRHLLVGLLLFAASSSAGCLVLSFHPAYEPATIVFDKRLIGTWESSEIGGVAIVESGEWKSYRITFTDRVGTVTLKVYETEIGGQRFLDATPAYGLERNLLVEPLHGVCRVSVGSDQVIVTAIDYDWMLKSVEAKAFPAVPFVIDERRNIVLTNESKQLRDWIRGRLETPEAFGAPVTFVRRSP